MFNFLKNQRIILASKSPRRAKLLKQIGIEFEIVESTIEEEGFSGNVSIEDFVMKMSDKKASNVAEKIPKGIIIGADTIVSIDGEILRKPKDRNDAVKILKRLSGRTHSVYTGVSLIMNPGNIKKNDFEITEVTFRDLNENEINYYVDSGDAFDKAGAYAIQGVSGVFVKKVSGCYFNVVGLPLTKVYLLMKSLCKQSVP